MLKDIPIRVDVKTPGSDKPQLAPTGKAILYELETDFFKTSIAIATCRRYRPSRHSIAPRHSNMKR